MQAGASLIESAPAAGDEAMRLDAVRDAITLYEQARHLLAERLHGLDRGATLPAAEIEHLSTSLRRAYELSGEWEKARAACTLTLARAQDGGRPARESGAPSRPATLEAPWPFAPGSPPSLLEGGMVPAGSRPSPSWVETIHTGGRS